MTEFQAKQIRDLRLKGTGYRAIASVVGLSRDIVRNYCKSHGLDGYASVLTINMKEQMMKGQACLACGKEIVQPMTGRQEKILLRRMQTALVVGTPGRTQEKADSLL